MDFREHQDKAKRNSRIIWLLYIFLLTTSSFLIGWTLIISVNLVELYQPSYEQYDSFWQKFVVSNQWAFTTEQLQGLLMCSMVCFLVQGLTTVVGFVKKSDGHKVAQAFNGRQLTDESANSLSENQALNIVAEQALAASVPTPSLYIIPEQGINAFAAGKTMDNAVVAITEGALVNFNRTELSGVIAHEIGHIVNQDIKLNIQISAFVFGFTALFFLARFMFYSALNRRVDGRAKLVIFAAAVVIAVIGALTVWLGRILQAAMSRQREFLADASAVQFTRYPEGLVQAFEVLQDGGKSTKVENPSSKEYAHAMMFGVGGELFATHPPLDERIKRIQSRI